ncbi:hypothetical protein EDB82DRAFT_550765 [Fusarium venenatum]|uniref:uncharacterized protein n=1 Tax=Fusarium venenatum TaxID=56646 RepID=UPI001DF8683B|nr:hypothetical protein EDB82DRAFT_550765 [Fusarium venenatum]
MPPTNRQCNMRLRSSGFLRWSSLPAEIRHMNLNTIVDLQNPGWAALASVSKEWQGVIGAKNMAKLKLQSSSCLDGFGQVVRQRHLVRHIYLCIELPKYKCGLCQGRSLPGRLNGIDSVVSKAIAKVLTVLSTWETKGPLTLELNTTSSSDTEHWAKNIRFDDDHDADNQDLTLAESNWYDTKHRWVDGVQVKPPSFFAMQQVFGLIILEHSSSVSVTAVTSLMVRRQFRRFLAPDSLDKILSQLVCLTDIIYEPCSSQNLSLASLRLEQLSISFLINAEDFVAACREEWTWDHMQSIALAFQGSGKRYAGSINSLLLSIAKLALRMPKLETMVLWNGGRGNSCAFIYTRNKYYARVLWRGTWVMDICQEALEVWEAVVALYSLELKIGHERIQEIINSYGDAIHHINLPCEIIPPTSLWQMRIEGA